MSLARRSVWIPALRFRAECWHRNETSDDHVCLTTPIPCRREREWVTIWVCKWVSGGLFHFTDYFSTEGQVTWYILKARDTKRQEEVEHGDRTMVNKSKIFQWNTTGRKHSNREKSNRGAGKGKVSVSSWEAIQNLRDFWAGILKPLLSQLASWSCSVLLGLLLVLLAEFTHSCINAPAVVNRDMRSLRRPRENLAHGFVCSSIHFQSDMTISL